MDGKLMVVTDGGDVKKLKDLQNKEDVMAKLAATSKKPSKEDHSPAAANIDPLLLASARRGSWEALNVLLEREDAKKPPMVIPTQEFLELLAGGSSAQGRVVAGRDVEEGTDHQPAASLAVAAGALLKGVTPDGDTALHAVARNHKGGQQFLKYAGILYDRDRGLLFEKNHEGDTPLHCAARAGNIEMVSHLIDLAAREGAGTKLRFLRTENERRETVLHEAVRFEDGRVLDAADPVGEEPQENNIVKLLMGADPQLANYPEDGVSPLYLAISLGMSTTALTLYHKSGGNLSYSGAEGQNALHVAALRVSIEMAEFLVHWKKSLTTEMDKDGSTPLHLAATVRSTQLLMILYKANPAALYQADKKGFFPIHLAASGDSSNAMHFFVGECPDSAGLRDTKGRTFLHVAVEKEKWGIVSHACGTPSLAWILNMQDNEGNTALHLAVKARSFRMFCSLLAHREVNMNLINNHGETPGDLSRSQLTCGELTHTLPLSPENMIYQGLEFAGANYSARRHDKTEGKYSGRPKPDDELGELDKSLKDATQSLIVASGLIATVAFGATFALPGGYRADDHTNGGTPTLAGSYVFDAFMMATTLAFIFSTLATIGFAFAAAPMVNLFTREINFIQSLRFMSSSVTCMTIAFALGVYLVLAPVARRTAIAVCVITPGVLLGPHTEEFIGWVSLAPSFFLRLGKVQGMVMLIGMVVSAIWPSIVIFGWAALASIHRHR